MRYESLTTGQTNPLLAAIRNLPDDLPSDNVGLLARLTGGETEGETDPVITDPDPEPAPLVFEIPPGNHTYMWFDVWLDPGGLADDESHFQHIYIYFDSDRPYFRDWYDGGTERLDRRVHREYDNPRRAIEEALASLPNVASAEVTFFADKWRIELTPGPGGITYLSVRGVSADNRLTLSGPAYEPIEQGAETDLTPALRDPPPHAPELTPDPAGETSPAPGALVFEIVYSRFIHWMVFTAYPDGQEAPGPDYRADIDLAYLHANGEAVPYGGEVVRGALAVHRLYADPADRIKAALEALPNVATAKLTLIGLDEPHPVTGRPKAWRIEITEGPGGVEKLSYVAGDFSGGGGRSDLAGGDLTPIEGAARRATWPVDDNLEGGSGDDTLRGGSGDDTLDGAAGDDKLYGGDGNDELRGGDGDNWLSGGPGDDTLYGDGAGDELYGGPGDDALYGGAGDDQELYGGPGDDQIYSGGGDALLSGGPGDDRLSGGGGADTFRFAPGHSSGGEGDVITDFDFGDGDRLMFIGISLDELTLSNRRDADGDGASDDRVITLPDGEKINLLNAGDFTVAELANAIDERDGGADDGADPPATGGGDDGATPPASGGAGAAPALGVRQNGGAGDDELTGGPGNDDLRGYGGDDELDGGAGNDRLAGMAGTDELDGGDGNDTMYGGPGDDELYGRAGDDQLYGGAGDDYLEGWAGTDRLYGGPGDDEIWGGPGFDWMTGGGGADTFRFAPGHSLGPVGDDGDVIADFDYAAGDRIMLSGFSSGDPTLFNRLDADDDGNRDDGAIYLPDGGKITLLNVGDSLAELAIENIII